MRKAYRAIGSNGDIVAGQVGSSLHNKPFSSALGREIFLSVCFDGGNPHLPVPIKVSSQRM